MTKENKVIIIGLLGLGALALLGAVFPVTSEPLSRHLVRQTASEEKSVSGTITSFDKNSFTLSIGSTASEKRQQNEKASMNFIIDANTTIKGRMHIEGNAEVAYRESNGHNLAVNVSVVE